MNQMKFISRWSGSPLVVASENVLKQVPLPAECRQFLGTVGLPSNALWFDRSNSAIMSFDSVAILRCLSLTDVSGRAWETVRAMGCFTILGIHSGSFVIADEGGELLIIQSDKHYRVGTDAAWKATMFLNQSPAKFAASLIAYKDATSAFIEAGYDFHSPKVKDAVATLRTSIRDADEMALANERNFWFQIVDHLDVW
jgi:hypothetical protein